MYKKSLQVFILINLLFNRFALVIHVSPDISIALSFNISSIQMI